MEIKVTKFKNGQVLIQDTEKMKTITGEIVEVVIREYATTKENLIGVLNYIESLEQEEIAKINAEQEQEKTQVENETTTEENKGEL